MTNDKYDDKYNNTNTQEAHGDWMAVEHNSDVSNKLSEKYGDHWDWWYGILMVAFDI